MYRGIKNEKNIVIRPILSTLCYIFAAEKRKNKTFFSKKGYISGKDCIFVAN